MKKTGFILLVFVLILGAGTIFWSAYQKPTETEAPAVLPAAQLTGPVLAYLPGQVVTPKSTAELRAWFDGSTSLKMPRVYVTRLPDDFAEKGDPVLFIQVFSALMMRENEQALRERVALIALKDKFESGQQWTPDEHAFFNGLVDKYDAVAERKIPSQIANLMGKVTVVPTSLGVAMAAEATNWGKENVNHPFKQQGWLDAEHYDYLPFESLIDATQSYFREMNGMPPLMEWRISRQQFQNMLNVTDIGYRSIRWMRNYMPQDDDYTDKVQAQADKMDTIAIDALTFFPMPAPFDFKRGKITLTTAKGAFPIDVEIAETDRERMRGLMFRAELPENNGMLFTFDKMMEAGVWMKNTFIPLDVLFYDDDMKVTHLVPNAQPFDETIHSSQGLAAGMLELPAGSIDRFGIQKGDTIKRHDAY